MPIRVFIDQGHNPSGANAGAEGYGLREQDITYAVGMDLARLLNGDPRFTARVSRTTPTESLGASNAASLQRRVYLANSWPADYLSAFTATPTPTRPSTAQRSMFTSRTPRPIGWPSMCWGEFVEEVGTRDNGVRLNPTLYVLAPHCHARHPGGAGLSDQRRRCPEAAG